MAWQSSGMDAVTAYLVRHTDSEADAIRQITAVVSHSSDRLKIKFVARGHLDRLKLTAPIGSRRADDLWRTTCFELFVEEALGYREYNFAPSGLWAAYEFQGYRSGRTDLGGEPVTEVRFGVDDHSATLTAVVPLPGRTRPVTIGLSAVEEDIEGHKAYWALAHPDGAPDFHHPVAFDLAFMTETRP